MPYRIRATDEAETDVIRLPELVRQRVRRLIKALGNDPKPSGAKELRGAPGYYRLRLDRWRVIYRVDENDLLILVLRVKRKTGPETYEGIAPQENGHD